MSNDKKQPGSLSSIIGLANSKSKVPVIQIVRQKPLAAAISKSVAPAERVKHTPDGTRVIETPSVHTLQQISNQTANNISQSDTTLQMIPDTELGAQILISAVISPKDMMTLELTYSVKPGLMSPAIVSALTTALRRQFVDVYKIKNKLPRILREVLFDKGSHVVAIIPENSIDEMINRNNAISLETYSSAGGNLNSYSHARRVLASGRHSIATGVGILGPGVAHAGGGRTSVGDRIFSAGMESISLNAYDPVAQKFDQHLTLAPSLVKPTAKDPITVSDVIITDNPAILQGPEIERRVRAEAIRSRLKNNQLEVGIESLATKSNIKLDDKSLMAAIYKSRKIGNKQMQVMKTDSQLERKTIGRPLVMELPPESVIPVFTPGQEDKHVGYFILLDQTGNPVRTSTETDTLSTMSRRLNSATNQQQNLINRLQQLTAGFGCTNDQEHADMMVRIYADMVEADLLARLRNGVYANSVALAKNTEYYRVMLTRVLAQQRTTILFMPVEMVTYFARKYNKYGIGMSILDDMKVINNIRAITTLANTLLGIRNSIPRTTVDLNIDETDPDPYKTAEMFLNEILRVNQTAVPLGASSPTDMLDFFQRAQYRMNIKGHPGIPDTSAEYTESNTSYNQVDTKLEEYLQDRAMMTMGLNSEIVKNGFNGSDTATSVVASNLMLSRRVAVLQEQINPHITDYHQKIIRADEEILSELREILDQNYEELDIDEETICRELGITQNPEIKKVIIDKLLDEFVDKLEVTLPKPETATLANQKDLLSNFVDLLDQALDAYINEDFFDAELGGELAESIKSVRAAIRAYYIRKYMAENGIMPDLAAIVAPTEEGEHIDFWQSQKNHIENLSKSLGNFMRSIHETKKSESVLKKAMDTEFQDAVDNAGTGSDGGGSDWSSSDSDSSGGDSDSSGGDDDFGLGAGGDMDFGDLGGNADGGAAEAVDDDTADNKTESGDDKPAA